MRLEKVKCIVSHINLRKEFHGEEEKLALDVKLEVRPLIVDMQAALEPFFKLLSTMPLRTIAYLFRNTHGMQTTTFAAGFENHDVVIYSDVGFELITLHDAKVNKFTMNWKELAFTFRVQMALDHADDVSTVSQLLNREVVIDAYMRGAAELPLSDVRDKDPEQDDEDVDGSNQSTEVQTNASEASTTGSAEAGDNGHSAGVRKPGRRARREETDGQTA